MNELHQVSVLQKALTRIHAALSHHLTARIWRHRGLTARLLYPLSLLTGLLRRFQRMRYRRGLSQPKRLPVPVVVVGNLYAGGTGKTPLVMALATALRERGFHPGVISRGYGARGREARLVDPESSAQDVGDEPLLIAQKLGIAVAIGRDRHAAGTLLLSAYPSCDVILCDDGLQHQRLARDLELALIHSLGLGNGWLLPAGPLRDNPDRLKEVDAVVFHGDHQDIPVTRVYSPFFRMRTQPGEVYALQDPQRRIRLGELASEQARSGTRLIAAAGIGLPERFFASLRAAGLEIDTIALPDHARFEQNPFANKTFDCALITEKDAVKCRKHPAMAADGRICVVSQSTWLEPALVDFVIARLQRCTNQATDHGLSTPRHTGVPTDQRAPAL
ncbi:MAG TPA: tetraacyldisaccharide 4'-kinase [Burkholderiaceae bacterium]|nr:tetraacyldisaccharide 4'-kinase [Burkholderiaceae bacterium]